MPKQAKKKTSILTGIANQSTHSPVIVKMQSDALPSAFNLHPHNLTPNHHPEDSLKKLGSNKDWICDGCKKINSSNEYKCSLCKKMNPTVPKDFIIRKDMSAKKIERKQSEKKIDGNIQQAQIPASKSTQILSNNNSASKASRKECVCYETKDESLFKNGRCKICNRHVSLTNTEKINLQESNFTFGGRVPQNQGTSHSNKNVIQISNPLVAESKRDNPPQQKRTK